MPLTDIQVRDYQSLAELNLRLGSFTVITGATGSGKTSVFRAARLAVFNAKGTGYIRRGQKAAKAVIGSEDGDGLLGVPWAIGIERTSKGGGVYRLSTATLQDGHYTGEHEVTKEYTKLGGSVPEGISQMLGMGEINFASQFDAPYLLSERGSTVAHILGKLTGVTLLFAAARECARRRGSLAGDLKRAEAERDRLLVKAQGFSGLRSQVHAVQLAEESLERARVAELRATLLRTLLERLGDARHRLDQVAVPVPPSSASIDLICGRIQALRSLMGQHSDNSRAAFLHQKREHQERAAIVALNAELGDCLREAGVCPTCGRATV